VLLGLSELIRVLLGSDGSELEVPGLTTDHNQDAWIAVGILGVAGVVVALPATAALLHLLTRRAASLGHLAIGLLLPALVCHGAYVSLLAAANGSAARLTGYDGVDPGSSFVTLLYTNTLETPLALLALISFIGLLVGLLAVANGLWSSKLFPRWVPVAIALAGISNVILEVVAYALLTAAWGWIGWRVLRMSTQGWKALGQSPSAAEVSNN
jgi:hypothetical protein